MKGSTKVLGINYGGHDTSAALMIDGIVVSACEEERYRRIKHCRHFPTYAIEDCLKIAGILINDVDEVAFGFDPVYHIREAYLRRAMESSTGIEFLFDDIDRIKKKQDTELTIREATGYTGLINYYKHHECHLASAYYPSGFHDALVASYDGIGEIETGLLGIGRNGKIEVIHSKSRFPHSLGLLYSAITYYLGWQHHSDEGIVMGLATYGNADKLIPGSTQSYYQVFEDILIDKGGFDYEINLDWVDYHNKRDSWVSEKFLSCFGESREPDAEPNQNHMDIAAALQKRLEVVVLKQMERATAIYGIDHLCLAGGVALNCSLNGKLESSDLFKEIFVQPASGDSGVAIGACYLAERRRNPSFLPERNSVSFLGGGSDSEEIDKALVSSGLDSTMSRDVLSWTSKQLANGRIVGWYQGRSEFGPRALGNRSILTRPYPASMKDHVNSRVKFRESFRPFAPAVMVDYLEDYFQIGQESPHMLIACQAKEAAKTTAPATVHVDNTCRVQSVSRDQNQLFYDLLKTFYEETGSPILLNTSFNIKGQPIVNTAEEAINCFLSTNIDCLILGDYFVDKNDVPKELLRTISNKKYGKREAHEYFGEQANVYGQDYQEIKYQKYPANRYRLNLVQELITQLKPNKILDIASGTGDPLIAIKNMGFDIEGFDISERMLNKAHKNLEHYQLSKGLIHRNDMEHPIGLVKESYDCLLALGAVYYARDFAKTMRGMTALLAPGGSFIFSLRNSLFGLYSSNEYTNRFLRDELIPQTPMSVSVQNSLDDYFSKKSFGTNDELIRNIDSENVHSIMHNPLTIEESVLEPFGLALQNIYYYHYHALPPFMERVVRDEFQEMSSLLEGTSSWRSQFIASSFIVHSIKPEQVSG